ncbi:MAG: L,D-transpeptidase [Chloroflexi bacterium]|nr:L,D-transpeptidase [Chloroflexota bacterium]
MEIICSLDATSFYYFIRPYNVRILPADELTPLSPEVEPEEKYIQVRLDEQLVLAYEAERLVFRARASTGKGEFNTPTGWFKTFHKRPTAHMVGGESEAALYDLTGVPPTHRVLREGLLGGISTSPKMELHYTALSGIMVAVSLCHAEQLP